MLGITDGSSFHAMCVSKYRFIFSDLILTNFFRVNSRFNLRVCKKNKRYLNISMEK